MESNQREINGKLNESPKRRNRSDQRIPAKRCCRAVCDRDDTKKTRESQECGRRSVRVVKTRPRKKTANLGRSRERKITNRIRSGGSQEKTRGEEGGGAKGKRVRKRDKGGQKGGKKGKEKGKKKKQKKRKGRGGTITGQGGK